jgi:heat shock protein HslJ
MRLLLSISSLLLCSFHLMAAQAQSTSTDLKDTSWQLVKFAGGDDQTLVPSDPAEYAIAFYTDGTVNVRIACNRGRGTWKSSQPAQLQFGPIALTRAMCPPAPLNNRLPRDLDSVRSYVLKDGHLFLSLMADGGTYEFSPASEPASLGKLPTVFQGTLPCADCPGIVYRLNLLPDHIFSLRMKYKERATSFEQHGKWQITENGKTLTLQSEKKTSKFAIVDADTLRQLDQEGKPIAPGLNYDLKRVEAAAQHSPGIENTEWKLVELDGSPITPSADTRQPGLTLERSTHRASGMSGCNRYTGSYTLKGDTITFSQVAGTMMACLHGMDTEKQFLHALSIAYRWKIAGPDLVLLDKDGRSIAKFKAAYAK